MPFPAAGTSGEELAFLPELPCKSTHLPQVPEEGGAWLLPWSSSRAECLLVPRWESGFAWGPSLQPAGADQEVKAELIGRQEPTCPPACNGDPSVSGGALRERGLCRGEELRTPSSGT